MVKSVHNALAWADVVLAIMLGLVCFLLPVFVVLFGDFPVVFGTDELFAHCVVVGVVWLMRSLPRFQIFDNLFPMRGGVGLVPVILMASNGIRMRRRNK